MGHPSIEEFNELIKEMEACIHTLRGWVYNNKPITTSDEVDDMYILFSKIDNILFKMNNLSKTIEEERKNHSQFEEGCLSNLQAFTLGEIHGKIEQSYFGVFFKRKLGVGSDISIGISPMDTLRVMEIVQRYAVWLRRADTLYENNNFREDEMSVYLQTIGYHAKDIVTLYKNLTEYDRVTKGDKFVTLRLFLLNELNNSLEVMENTIEELSKPITATDVEKHKRNMVKQVYINYLASNQITMTECEDSDHVRIGINGRYDLIKELAPGLFTETGEKV